MIKFNKASITKKEEEYVIDALYNSNLSGDGKYTKRVYTQFKERFGIGNMLLTTSGTSALEMAAILSDLQQDDEVIAPSFTFSSTINAFLLRGAKAVFCDVREDTYNIDETLIEDLITDKTKAIYVVHYAGVPCEMDTIIEIANKYNLYIIEDAAQAVGSYYKGRIAGTLTEFGCYSFHETKNYAMGEGGAIIVNESKYMERAEIIREKGTNRSNLLKGLVDKYTWHDIGSSYLPSDLLAAVLSAQLDRFDEIMEKRMRIWNLYQEGLQELEEAGKLRRPFVPEGVIHNAHMYSVLLPDAKTRDMFIKGLKERGVQSHICYVPLHSAPYGLSLGYTPEMFPVTEFIGSRMTRLPLFADMSEDEAITVINVIKEVLQ